MSGADRGIGGWTIPRRNEPPNRRIQAIDYYSQFVDLWKEADPELQPQLEAAREALARLMAEPGG